MDDEYAKLVAFYLGKLDERYNYLSLRPEVIQSIELLKGADEEKVKEILKLLREG